MWKNTNRQKKKHYFLFLKYKNCSKILYQNRNFTKKLIRILKITFQPNLQAFLTRLSETFEKMRRIEGRVANDQDLKLSDCLRYHMRDTTAAKDLLYRRLRCLANYEKSNKAWGSRFLQHFVIFVNKKRLLCYGCMVPRLKRLALLRGFLVKMLFS